MSDFLSEPIGAQFARQLYYVMMFSEPVEQHPHLLSLHASASLNMILMHGLVNGYKGVSLKSASTNRDSERVAMTKVQNYFESE